MRRSRRRSPLHLLLLALLALSQVLLPAFGAACETSDELARAATGEAGADQRAACCDTLACSDCCLPASVASTSAVVLPTIRFARVDTQPPTAAVPRGAYPVDVRPPI